MSYEYDVFLSYPREPPVGPWAESFNVHLEQWLGQHIPWQARVFFDREDINVGDAWPERLRRALLRSRVLVAVWSPSYFRSRTCMAELETMAKRERLLGFRTDERPEGLVFPVRFSDGDYFPRELSHIQLEDFEDVATLLRSAQRLRNRVNVFAQKIAPRIVAAPDWQEGWPVVALNGQQLAQPDDVRVPFPRL